MSFIFREDSEDDFSVEEDEGKGSAVLHSSKEERKSSLVWEQLWRFGQYFEEDEWTTRTWGQLQKMRDFQCAKVQEEGLIEDVWDGNSGAMILSPYWYALMLSLNDLHYDFA
jgi:hypothetical protein